MKRVFYKVFSYKLREWSLITGRGGLQNGRGGHLKFYPYQKGGGKSFSHSEGGAQKVLGLILRGSLKFKPYCRGGA